MIALATIAVLISAFTWWFATGAVIWLGRLDAEWHGVASLSLAVPAGMAGLLAFAVRDEASVVATIAGFIAAIAIWGWHEATFLFGQVLGPRREPCPIDATSRERFSLAFRALRDHEFALAATLLLIVVATWGAANTIAAQTFATLWLCRLAAKLCIFEGVPAMAHDLMPERLRHLKSYFGDARPGAAFALAIAGMGTAFGVLIAHAIAAEGATGLVGATLLATLVALAIIEHAFMVLPVRDERLWRWAVPHGKPLGEGACTFMDRAIHTRRLQGVALEARAVVPTDRAT